MHKTEEMSYISGFQLQSDGEGQVLLELDNSGDRCDLLLHPLLESNPPVQSPVCHCALHLCKVLRRCLNLFEGNKPGSIAQQELMRCSSATVL